MSWLSRRLGNGCSVLAKSLVGTSKTGVDTASPQQAASLAACTRPCTGWRRKVQRVTVSRGCLITSGLLSPAIRRTLIGLRHSTPLLDRLAGCGQWQGAHAAGGRAAARSRPPRRENQVAELESWGRGWLGVGFQAPYPAVIQVEVHTGHAACQAGTYVDGLRAAVTRVPLDRFVYARRPDGGGRLAALQKEARDGWAWRTRGVSGPVIAHPQRQHRVQ